MIITKEIRRKLRPLLPSNYRQIVAERCGCHPNTVSNALNHGADNPQVVLALLELAQETSVQREEENEVREKARAIASQL